MHHSQKHQLKLVSLGIDTYHENIIFMRRDCHICKSEGFDALTRVTVNCDGKSIIATINLVKGNFLQQGEAGLSESAFKKLNAKPGNYISISHLKPILSLSHVRAKMYRQQLSDLALEEIINDVTNDRYSDIELAAFVSACAGDNLNLAEITGLTKAMIKSGNRLTWDKQPIYDKHCIGGLPGNRTTPIVVAIVAAAGLWIPKTSSRAITSPAGTADVMETMAPVNLSGEQIKNIVQNHGGCIAWGGAVDLSPADDKLIRVEKALDIDSAGQMIASVLSKKAAAGSTHLVLEIPFGPTVKVRSKEEALKLQYYFTVVAAEIGITVKVIITKGNEPVGYGLGPALEAMDVLAVLRNETKAHTVLRSKALMLAGELIELSSIASPGTGLQKAEEILNSGKAWEKFKDICIAQGGFTEPYYARHHTDILAKENGIVTSINNRVLARIAKLAGAPENPGSGIYFNASLGKKISKGDKLFTIYADAEGELAYALDYFNETNHLITITPQ